MKRNLIIITIMLLSFITGVVISVNVIMSNAKIEYIDGVYEVEVFGQVFIYE